MYSICILRISFFRFNVVVFVGHVVLFTAMSFSDFMSTSRLVPSACITCWIRTVSPVLSVFCSTGKRSPFFINFSSCWTKTQGIQSQLPAALLDKSKESNPMHILHLLDLNYETQNHPCLRPAPPQQYSITVCNRSMKQGLYSSLTHLKHLLY